VPYSTARAAANWDSYIHSIGFVEQSATNFANSQSTGDRVFDGLSLRGSSLPYLGAKTNMALLAGRLTTNRYESGFQLTRPFLKERLGANLTYYTIQDSFGDPQPASLSLKCGAADLTFNLGSFKGSPLLLHAEGGVSRLFTGADRWNPALTPAPLDGAAGRATFTWYPFTVEGMYLDPAYANVSGKATIEDIDFGRYGTDVGAEAHGTLGESDQMLTNRRGWRVNLGWNGRRTDLLRSLPSWLDQVVMNVNLAAKREFQAVPWTQTVLGQGQNPIRGAYTVMGPNLVALDYPEWQGSWAGLYGGYDKASPVRSQYNQNIGAEGGLPFTTYDFRGNTEAVVLRDPLTGAPLSHRKTFHYFDVTEKFQLDKWLHSKKALYLGAFYSVTRVSGEPTEAGQAAIHDLFTRTILDVAVFRALVLPRTHAMAHVAFENWDSQWSIPKVDWRRKVWGVGMAYEIPWGGSMADLRVNRFTFRSASVPANDYDGFQVLALARFLF